MERLCTPARRASSPLPMRFRLRHPRPAEARPNGWFPTVPANGSVVGWSAESPFFGGFAILFAHTGVRRIALCGGGYTFCCMKMPLRLLERALFTVIILIPSSIFDFLSIHVSILKSKYNYCQKYKCLQGQGGELVLMYFHQAEEYHLY